MCSRCVIGRGIRQLRNDKHRKSIFKCFTIEGIRVVVWFFNIQNVLPTGIRRKITKVLSCRAFTVHACNISKQCVCCAKFNYSQEYDEYRMREAVDRQSTYSVSKRVWRSNNCCDRIETTFNSAEETAKQLELFRRLLDVVFPTREIKFLKGLRTFRVPKTTKTNACGFSLKTFEPSS